MTHFIFYSNPWLLPAIMLVILTLSIELPFRLAAAPTTVDPTKNDSWNTIQAALLTLAAFVLGLSFAQAAARYDERRLLVVQEANAIGTTWLRADQLQPTEAATFRRILTDYTDTRLNAYEIAADPSTLKESMARNERDQAAMWLISSSALRAHPANLGLGLLTQTLNDTIDVSSEQLQALTSRVPTIIILLTLGLLTLATLATGIRFARDGSRPLVLSAILVLASVVVVSLVIDYDRPQTGFVRTDLSPLKTQLQAMHDGKPATP